MNIHFFNSDPVENAKYLDDIRCRKMLVENMQMMASALHRHGAFDYIPLNKQGTKYRVSHENHPSTRWAGDSKANLLWLCDYSEALYDRYKAAGGKAYTNVPANLQRVREGAFKLPDLGLTKFVNCAKNSKLNIDFTDVSDTYKAYELYMAQRWNMDTIKLTWTGIK